MNRWKDWYEQGIRDFERAKLDYEYKYYEWGCFTAHQSAEKVLKALALKLGFNVWGHSLSEILNIIASKIEISEELKDETLF
jgi:HEPN domain-containing protein